MKRRSFLALAPAVALGAPVAKLLPATFNGIPFPAPFRIVRYATTRALGPGRNIHDFIDKKGSP